MSLFTAGATGKHKNTLFWIHGLDASGVWPISDLSKCGHFSYGFGSRVRVGRFMADNSLYINIGILLWAMKIERKKDALGRFLPMDVDGWVDVG